jgi:hypothetical protein
MRINLDACHLQLLQQPVQIIHTIVHHEAGFARPKILRASRKDRPSLPPWHPETVQFEERIVPALVCNQFIVREKLSLHSQPKVLRAST